MFVGVMPVLFEENANFLSRINSMADKYPFYIVGLAFLMLTLIVEIPIVFVGLKGNTTNKKRLAILIIVANIITTIPLPIVKTRTSLNLLFSTPCLQLWNDNCETRGMIYYGSVHCP